MKRDWDLIRTILLAIEDHDDLQVIGEIGASARSLRVLIDERATLTIEAQIDSPAEGADYTSGDDFEHSPAPRARLSPLAMGLET